MMIHAYRELYLDDATKSLSSAFDYAINDCKIAPDWFSTFFVQSGVATQFENGNPIFISGKSGVELVHDILEKVYQEVNLPPPSFFKRRTKEYWAGWALAQYQWATSKKFKNIFERIPLSEIITMYNPYHEMDISHFIDAMNTRYNKTITKTNLRKLREYNKMSQQELATLSGVNIRSIQLYEQQVNDIDKAQGSTLYKLSRVLKCNIEDLLENPEET